MRRAQDEVTGVLFVQEPDAAHAELVREPQAADQTQEPVVGELADRRPCHLQDELPESQVVRWNIHGRRRTPVTAPVETRAVDRRGPCRAGP